MCLGAKIRKQFAEVGPLHMGFGDRTWLFRMSRSTSPAELKRVIFYYLLYLNCWEPNVMVLIINLIESKITIIIKV